MLTGAGFRVVLPNIHTGSADYGAVDRPQLGDWGGVGITTTCLRQSTTWCRSDGPTLTGWALIGLYWQLRVVNWLVVARPIASKARRSPRTASPAQVSCWAMSDAGPDTAGQPGWATRSSPAGVERCGASPRCRHVADVCAPRCRCCRPGRSALPTTGQRAVLRRPASPPAPRGGVRAVPRFAPHLRRHRSPRPWIDRIRCSTGSPPHV
ncbi:MAG: hypothetical protein R2713_13635 [Ilumatobacteraceae bacterium]